jgi:tRNA1Val (adenine37-N6)-methyltransferase
MAAQRLAYAGCEDFHIDAIDIEPGAVADSADNFAASPWATNLSVRQISLQDFADEVAPASYDVIFCNPPYYDDSPSSRSAERDAARSTDTLSRRDLLFAAAKLLSERGRLSLILPFDQGKKMILEATLFGWFLRRQCFVKTKKGALPKRLMLEFSPSAPSRLETETLVIGDERYKQLISGFYLQAL